MELPEMICLPALCIGPLKGRVIGFWVGARADVRVHFGAALHSSGIMGYDGRLNEHILYGRAWMCEVRLGSGGEH